MPFECPWQIRTKCWPGLWALVGTAHWVRLIEHLLGMTSDAWADTPGDAASCSTYVVGSWSCTRCECGRYLSY